MSARNSRLRRELHDEKADDVAFGRLYSPPIRAKSVRFWTPVAVALRAAELLASQNVTRVLDIGSGAGNFCLVAACACPDIEFIGIEQRPHLVDVESGMCLGSFGAPGFDLELAAAGSTEVVRARKSIRNRLGVRRPIEDILFTIELK